MKLIELFYIFSLQVIQGNRKNILSFWHKNLENFGKQNTKKVFEIITAGPKIFIIIYSLKNTHFVNFLLVLNWTSNIKFKHLTCSYEVSYDHIWTFWPVADVLAFLIAP